MKKQAWNKLRDKAGFTLVELIVVIAILGILAGIGTVGYSGYVKKANEAADQQLLGYINTAFSVACMEENVDAKDVTNASLSIGSSGTDAGSLTVELPSGASDDAIVAAFAKYLAANQSSPWKYYTGLDFKSGEGVFAGIVAGALKSIVFGSNNYNINVDSINAYKDSAFNGNEAELQEQVNSLTKAYGDLVGGNLSGLENSFGEGYVNFINSYLGNQGINPGDENYSTALANATVLYVAKQSDNLDAQSAYSTLLGAKQYMVTNAGGNPSLLAMLGAANASGDPLTTAAMMYGAITGYANRNEDAALKAQAAAVNDSQSLMNLFMTAASNDDFLHYCGDGGATPSENFSKDMEGYFGALNVFDTVSVDVSVGTGDVWSTEAINQLLQDVLG